MPFNIGPGELIIVLVIALVVLGPGKLPDVAASLGKSLREFRKAASDVTEATRVDTPAPSAATGHSTATATPPPPAANAVAPVPAAPTHAEPSARVDDVAPPGDEGAAGAEPARDPNAS